MDLAKEVRRLLSEAEAEVIGSWHPRSYQLQRSFSIYVWKVLMVRKYCWDSNLWTLGSCMDSLFPYIMSHDILSFKMNWEILGLLGSVILHMRSCLVNLMALPYAFLTRIIRQITCFLQTHYLAWTYDQIMWSAAFVLYFILSTAVYLSRYTPMGVIKIRMGRIGEGLNG